MLVLHLPTLFVRRVGRLFLRSVMQDWRRFGSWSVGSHFVVWMFGVVFFVIMPVQFYVVVVFRVQFRPQLVVPLRVLLVPVELVTPNLVVVVEFFANPSLHRRLLIDVLPVVSVVGACVAARHPG